jgi:hypothetical protein
MKTFDLEKALAGEKVVDIDGDKVTQLTHFKTKNKYCLFGICAGVVEKYTLTGAHEDGVDLFMTPKKLSGFVNVYSYGSSSFTSRAAADNDDSRGRLACIDLSQFEEGHGL